MRMNSMLAMKRVQVLSVSSKRLLSATAISHSPLPRIFSPQHCHLSPQFTSAGDEKISFSGTATDSPSLFVSTKRSDASSKEDTTDCYFKTTSALIEVSKLLEVEKVSIMLYKCKTIKQLKEIHLRMLINGLRDDDNCNYLADKAMLLTSDLISFDYAYKVLMYLSSNPNISSYNILIESSIGKSDYIAASAYNRMCNQDNISPDRFTFGFLFKSFASSDWLKGGEMMHAHVIKLGFVSDTFVMNSLLELYFELEESASRNQLRAVRNVFDEMPERDIVSWNAMISGLVNCRFLSEALSVFDDMLLLADHGCKPDETTLINIIKACNRMDLIEQGNWLDAYIKENKLVLSLPLGNALIGMLLSYNDLGNMKVVFKSMSRRCAFTWRSMLRGLVENMFCKEVLMLFDTICCCSVEGGLKPDDDIFYPVLAAFHSDMSLLGDGKRLFRAIHKLVYGFGVKPGKNDYCLMIRILAEAGWVEAAMMLAESLPWEPSEYVWGHLLYTCQIHGNENLLDSWIRKINEVNSKQDDHLGFLKKRCFVNRTLVVYINTIIRERHNDVNCVKLMVDSLITKLPEQKLVDWLNKYMRETVENNASSEAYNHRKDWNKYAHTQEARTLFEDGDDVCKLLKSLNRQLLDFHDQMISITDDPCQLAT
ncbi:hypothetical protein CASFOL_003020 [Castilleja foliolosa]|uniref:Pentatricopeptide repeat-containing protein n=1 Tax=Castilleja foliolosa TaxID=1961234 RepID=A0ABD3EGH4_9LAMI